MSKIGPKFSEKSDLMKPLPVPVPKNWTFETEYGPNVDKFPQKSPNSDRSLENQS